MNLECRITHRSLSAKPALRPLGSNIHKQFLYSWTYASGSPPQQTIPTTQGVRLTLIRLTRPSSGKCSQIPPGGHHLRVRIAGTSRTGRIRATVARAKILRRTRPCQNSGSRRCQRHCGRPGRHGRLYFAEHFPDVTALICRCMPSQFHTLAGQKDYELDQTPPTTGVATGSPEHPSTSACDYPANSNSPAESFD